MPLWSSCCFFGLLKTILASLKPFWPSQNNCGLLTNILAYSCSFKRFQNPFCRFQDHFALLKICSAFSRPFWSWKTILKLSRPLSISFGHSQDRFVLSKQNDLISSDGSLRNLKVHRIQWSIPGKSWKGLLGHPKEDLWRILERFQRNTQ